MTYTVGLVLLVVLGVTRAQNIPEVEMGTGDAAVSLSQRVTDQMLKKCIDNGDTQALQKARTAATRGEDCFGSAKDILHNLLHKTNITERRDVEESCRTLLQLKCTEKFHADVFPCYSDHDVAFFNVTQQMGKNFLNHVCGPELRIYDLTTATPEGRQCFDGAVQNMTMICRKQLMEDSENKNEDVFRRIFEPRICRKVKQAIECGVRHLEVCKRPSEYTSVDVVIGSMISMGSAIPPCPEETASTSDNVV